MQLPQIVEVKGIRVLTSKQLAEEYGTTTDRIKQNFGENRKYFIDGKHYISLTGDELKVFKNQVRKENNQVGKNALVANRTAHLYLWTEKGALLHAKSLNTDKAWQVYDYLVDFYFRVKENPVDVQLKKEIVPTKTKVEHVQPDVRIPAMKDPIFIFKSLLALAEEQNITLKLVDMLEFDSILRGNRIAIRKNQTFEKIVYELAYELAHYFIHYQNGNLIQSPLERDYNKQAENAAAMMIRIMDMRVQGVKIM
mgnify:CR=1 FL=1